MKLELQAKLLKAIEQQKVRRLGGTKDIQCNVRIIAASARNLQQMVSEGKFREDLFYRLAVLEVPVAPLRQRREDIALLVHDRLDYEQQLASLPTPFEIQDEAVTELAVYDWPGNIRQLHNVLSRLATRTDEGMPITAAAARSEIARFQPGTSNKQSTVASERAVLLPADCRMLLQGESMEDFVNRLKRTLIESVRKSTGSMTHAAKRLQCDRTALQKLIARLIANDNASEEGTDSRRSAGSLKTKAENRLTKTKTLKTVMKLCTT